MLANITKWWETLEARERLMLSVGSVVVAITLLYFCIWLPFAHALLALQAEVKQQNALLFWMQQAVPQLKNIATTDETLSPTQPLLNTLDQSLQQQHLQKFVTQLSQEGTDQVQVKFAAVSFDELARWLTLLWQKYSIKVTQANLTPTTTIGQTQAELTLQVMHQEE